MTRTRKAANRPPPATAHADAEDSFLDAFLADWRADGNGKAVIESLRKDKPADYVRIAASIFAKQADQETDPLRDLTDAELADRIAKTAASIGLEIRPCAPARRIGAADGEEPGGA